MEKEDRTSRNPFAGALAFSSSDSTKVTVLKSLLSSGLLGFGFLVVALVWHLGYRMIENAHLVEMKRLDLEFANGALQANTNLQLANIYEAITGLKKEQQTIPLSSLPEKGVVYVGYTRNIQTGNGKHPRVEMD